MKSNFLLLFLLISKLCIAQNNYGKSWVVYDPNNTLTFQKQVNGQYNFILNSTLGFPPYAGYNFLGDSRNSICDSLTGNLLFVTNGVYIYDAQANVFNNSDSLITPYAYTKYFARHNKQGTLILPKANRKFDIFFSYFSDAILDSSYYDDLMLHHLIDMNANSGQGTVIKKQENILPSNIHLSTLNMDAVRHANGVDWWILKLGYGMGKFDSLYLYTWLVKEDTILGPFAYYAGPNGNAAIDCSYHYKFAELKFSIDGTMFAGTHGCNTFYYGNFNRCSGAISNIKFVAPPLDSTYTMPNDTTIFKDSTFATENVATGILISPNNKYIYLVGRWRILQYDIAESNTNLAFFKVMNGFDTTFAPYSYGKGSMQYAPDSSIIIFPLNGSTPDILNVIEHPDVKGKGCGYRFDKIKYQPGAVFPVSSNHPNHPNWLLGADSTLCWPLSINQIASNKQSWSIYPNPTQNILTVLFTSTLSTTQKIEIYNMQGQLVQQCFANKGQSKYNVSLQVPNGIYIVKINNECKRLVVE
jgi:hypothetical protein